MHPECPILCAGDEGAPQRTEEQRMPEEQRAYKRAYVWEDTHREIKRLAALWGMEERDAVDKAVQLAMAQAIKELKARAA